MPRTPRAAIATLTINPAADLCFEVDRIEPVRKLRTSAPRRDPGGGGINVARVVRRLGGKAVAVLAAGGPTGARLKLLLRAERVPFEAIEIVGETREDITAVDRASRQQYRFVMPGPRLRPAEQAEILARLAALRPTPAVVVASGSLTPGAPVGLYGRLARQLRAKGVKLALDTSGPALKAALEAGVWLFKPNLGELRAVTGAPLSTLPERLAACQAAIGRGGAELVALSMGAEGAMLVGREQAWIAGAPVVTVASAVGAGDSFMAGLVLALAEGSPSPEALRRAVAAGTAALLAEGTQLARAADAERLAARVGVSALCEAAPNRKRRLAG